MKPQAFNHHAYRVHTEFQALKRDAWRDTRLIALLDEALATGDLGLEEAISTILSDLLPHSAKRPNGSLSPITCAPVALVLPPSRSADLGRVWRDLPRCRLLGAALSLPGSGLASHGV